MPLNDLIHRSGQAALYALWLRTQGYEPAEIALAVTQRYGPGVWLPEKFRLQLQKKGGQSLSSTLPRVDLGGG